MDTKENISHKSRLKPLVLTVGALTLACLLQGCGGGDDQTSPQNTSLSDTTQVTESTETSTLADSTTTDPTAALRTYYEDLISELRQELLDEREDRYISDHQYQNRLEALEETIAALENALEDTPTGGEPTTDTTSDTTSDTEAETEAPTPSVFTYSVSNGQACITAYNGTSETVNVPAEIDGYTVVAIGDQAFQNTPVRSVILPATVREIGWFAFGGCYGLELVSIPTSVEKINYGAFDGCPQVVILCAADSYASAYAVSFGLSHQYV